MPDLGLNLTVLGQTVYSQRNKAYIRLQVEPSYPKILPGRTNEWTRMGGWVGRRADGWAGVRPGGRMDGWVGEDG